MFDVPTFGAPRQKLTQVQGRYRTEGTQSGTFEISKQPLNPRRTGPRDLLNDVAGCIHTSRRQVA